MELTIPVRNPDMKAVIFWCRLYLRFAHNTKELSEAAAFAAGEFAREYYIWTEPLQVMRILCLARKEETERAVRQKSIPPNQEFW